MDFDIRAGKEDKCMRKQVVKETATKD